MISRIHEAETLARTFDEYNLSSLVEVDIVNFKSTVQAFIKNLGWKWRISTSSKTIFHTDRIFGYRCCTQCNAKPDRLFLIMLFSNVFINNITCLQVGHYWLETCIMHRLSWGQQIHGHLKGLLKQEYEQSKVQVGGTVVFFKNVPYVTYTLIVEELYGYTDSDIYQQYIKTTVLNCMPRNSV